MSDINDLNLVHPASYHYAIEMVRHQTEALRTLDAGHRLAIKSWLNWMRTAILSGEEWDVTLGPGMSILTPYSRNAGWLSRELYYKWYYANATNAAEILADVIEVKQLATPL